jgi:hypothetical protein
MPLPQALLRRLDLDPKTGVSKSGTALAESGPTEITIPRFQELLAFDLRFRSDEITVMLRLLDGFTVGGVTLASLVDFAKTVEDYQAAVSSPEGKGDARTRALRGFGKLLAAMLRLDTLLADCEPCPLLQSSIWHYYEYWMQRVAAETSLVEIISSWQNLPASEDADDERNALAEYVRQIQAAFQRLTSLQYRRVPILSTDVI